MEKYEQQEYRKVCEHCKPFRKYGTLRLEREGENECSVCGKEIKGKVYIY